MADFFSRIRDKFSGSTSSAARPNFAGRWFTTFGPMELSQDGDKVHGAYEFQGNRCPIEGRVDAGRLNFSYQEPTVRGEGWFEIKRHGKFAGQWRPEGGEQWGGWSGHREFDGVWESSFGLLRLVQEAERLIGFYEGAGPCGLEGKLDGNRLTFRYREPKAQGDGYFELASDNASFNGEWRAAGGDKWAPWQGRRFTAMPGVMWLVVIEAHWQRSYLDREYAFGHMLREFFARLPHVHVRQRFFEDESALARWCRELMYLPEPVAVVLASHGTQDGLCAGGRPLDTRAAVESLRYADNVMLLHFSSCLMLQDGSPDGFARQLQEAVQFPITGYDRSVDWAASALIEFHYLDMVLGRGLAPTDAAEQVIKLIGYAGADGVANSPYPAAGFRILLPPGK